MLVIFSVAVVNGFFLFSTFKSGCSNEHVCHQIEIVSTRALKFGLAVANTSSALV